MQAKHITKLRAKLSEHFGFVRFRPGQAEAVLSALEGNDTIVLMPTGSGKSLCYQLPALELDGVTIVVSPLISLMKDQVDKLVELGFAAVAMNSALTAKERDKNETLIRSGRAQFIYTTPERLTDRDFRNLISTYTVDLFVVDEAHCISQWGHDFRPHYLLLAEACERLGRPPILALTATATGEIIDDISLHLKLRDPEVVSTGFYRPNIELSVMPVDGDEAKRTALVSILKSSTGSGIIYAATVKAVDEVSAFLNNTGTVCDIYHGKMSSKKRKLAQERFTTESSRLIVATNAFGLGIDNDKVSFVIHYHIPGSIEAFYQEFGRAGRSGQPARAVLLYDSADAKLQRFLNATPSPDATAIAATFRCLSALLVGNESVELSQLDKSSSISKAQLRSSLTVLIDQGIVTKLSTNRYLLSDLVAKEIDWEAIAAMYFRRRETQQQKVEQMCDYAERRQCRWCTILQYFDSSELGAEICGTCDCCDLPVDDRPTAVSESLCA